MLRAGDLWGIYRSYVDEHDNIELLFGCEGKKLITDSDGAVIGIYAEMGDKTIAIKANKGVVLGTGGFDYNEQMRRYYLPFPLYRSVSSVMNTGAMKFENIPAYFIADSQYVSKYLLPGYCTPYAETGLPDYVKVFDTIEELADGMGIDKESLIKQLESFNENARNGVDPVFHRGESEDAYHDLVFAVSMCSLTGDASDLTDKTSTLGTVEVGPFYCVRYVPGTCGTRGGLLIDGDAQVLDTEGQKIPGLYAVGSCSSGVAGYWAGGACISQGSIMSYVAVKHMLQK